MVINTLKCHLEKRMTYGERSPKSLPSLAFHLVKRNTKNLLKAVFPITLE